MFTRRHFNELTKFVGPAGFFFSRFFRRPAFLSGRGAFLLTAVFSLEDFSA